MGKMPHRRMKRPEQDQIGCMWGFISMFDFRRGGYNRRLLPDKRFGNRVLCGAGLSQNTIRSLKEFDYELDDSDGESRQPMLGAGKPSVKKLMEEEMVVEEKRKQKSSEPGNDDSYVECQSHKRSSKAYQQKRKHFTISSLMEIEDFKNDTDVNEVVREIFCQIQQKSVGRVDLENEPKDNFCVMTEKKQTKLKKQLIQATEVVLHEKLISLMHLGQDENIRYSREFMDALDTVISHKELFFKLLEDPNSELARRINNLLNPEQEKCVSQKVSEGPHNRPHRLFSRRRARSQEVVLLTENQGSEAPRSTAVLDPEAEALSTSISVPSLKTKSLFSFTEIKRRLKHAIGKDREGGSMKNELARKTSRGNQVTRPGVETVGRMSKGRNPHLEAEIHPKRLSSPRRSDIGSMERSDMTFERESDSPSKQRMSNSNVEPTSKQHSQTLTGKDDYEKLSEWQDLELARESSSTPDRASSPTFSPSRKSSCTSPTAGITSPTKPLDSKEDSSMLEQDEGQSAQSSTIAFCESDDAFSTIMESSDPSPIISEHNAFDDEEDQSPIKMSAEGDVEDLLLLSSEHMAEELDTSDTTGAPQSSDTVEYEDTAEVINAVTITDCDEQDENEENSTTPSKTMLEPDFLGSDKTEHQFDDATSEMDRPSPISVLEPVYLEDEISPPSTKMLRGGLPATPLQIHFDEDDNNDISESDRSTIDKKSCDDKESKKKYVHEILASSGFSWDKVYMRSLSSDQLLNTSLYDADVDILSDQPSNDYKLLFDCLNEVLMDTCARYFGGSPLTSFSKNSVRPIPDIENAFREIWQRVEWHLLPLPPPRSLEQIVAKDLAKDGRWMDLRFDADNIGTEIEELVLHDLVEDTVMSCFREYTDDFKATATATESNADSN
ncbi:unnamed protein product [Rhodiola kirilowii]